MTDQTVALRRSANKLILWGLLVAVFATLSIAMPDHAANAARFVVKG